MRIGIALIGISIQLDMPLHKFPLGRLPGDIRIERDGFLLSPGYFVASDQRIAVGVHVVF